MHSHNYDIILEVLSGSNMAHILYNVMQSCDATKMCSGLYEKEKKPVVACHIGSLVPRLLPVFQCYTQKNGGAWYLIARDLRVQERPTV